MLHLIFDFQQSRRRSNSRPKCGSSQSSGRRVSVTKRCNSVLAKGASDKWQWILKPVCLSRQAGPISSGVNIGEGGDRTNIQSAAIPPSLMAPGHPLPFHSVLLSPPLCDFVLGSLLSFPPQPSHVNGIRLNKSTDLLNI